MERAIDEACAVTIARQLTASDLRLVIVIIKTISELERIGDVADKYAVLHWKNFLHSKTLISELRTTRTTYNRNVA